MTTPEKLSPLDAAIFKCAMMSDDDMTREKFDTARLTDAPIYQRTKAEVEKVIAAYDEARGLKTVDVIFKPKEAGDGPPDLIFIDCHTDDGKSTRVGEWVADGDYEALRLTVITA